VIENAASTAPNGVGFSNLLPAVPAFSVLCDSFAEMNPLFFVKKFVFLSEMLSDFPPLFRRAAALRLFRGGRLRVLVPPGRRRHGPPLLL